MKATIAEAEILVILAALDNLHSDSDRHLTIFLQGMAGTGKTTIAKDAAKKMGGQYVVLDGSHLNQGEIGGIPFPPKDGSDRFLFAKHNVNASIFDLEKYIYEKAKNEGFLGGKLKLDAEGNTIYIDSKDKKHIFPKLDKINSIFAGKDNMYKFGENLPAEVKYDLYLSGEIVPVFVVIDEINRADLSTQKELMNYVLNHEINGYKLPWWVNMVATGNPSGGKTDYASNRFDFAQRDRFIIIDVKSDIGEFAQYALDNRLDLSMLNALNSNTDLFLTDDPKAGKNNTDEYNTMPGGTPRSWEMISIILKNTEMYLNTYPKFSMEDKQREDGKSRAWDYIRYLIAGKIGDVASVTFLAVLENSKDWIKPEEIINGKTNKIDEDIMKKFKAQTEIHKRFTIDSVLFFLRDFVPYAKEIRTNEKTKMVYTNTLAQVTEFFLSLDPMLKKVIGKRITEEKFMPLYMEIGNCFSGEYCKDLRNFKKEVANVEGE